MERRRLGGVIGLGTYRTFEGDVARARAVVDAALAAGVTAFDSSPMYGAAEESLGAALDGRRDGATIATKIWAPDVAEGRHQYARQRRYFGRVDIEQVHNLVAWEEHVGWLEEERARGAVERIGVTHWSAGAFGELERALRTGRFDVVQVPLNPWERDVEHRLLPLAEELGIAVIVMRPFGGTGAPLLRREPAREQLESLRELGVETWAQALLAWVLSDSRVDLVIPATSRPDRVLENVAAGSPPWLGPDERAYVARLASS
jgi:aryl-alcohol dehydrogenase-like predicted oxidoreductase